MQPLEMSTDFECANAAKIERLGDAEFALATRPDRAVDNENYEMADYYMACRLINPNPEPVEATVTYRELAYPESGRTLAVRNLFPGRPPRVEDWIPLPPRRLEIDAAASTCRVRVTVAAEMSLDVSSMYWMSASQVYERLRQVEDRCRIGSLGKTAQGRGIPIIELTGGNEDAPLGVVAATPQSHELGTVAVMGILEAALAGKLDALSGRCRLALLPLANPDGNALGTCMTNSLRQNVIFGFGKAGSGQAAVECEAVWKYLVETRPCFFLEYHSYPHLNRPSFRPYDLDLRLFPDEESRKQGEIFFAAIGRVSPNPGVRLEIGSDIEKQFRPSLISRLVKERGIPATLYKLHNRETVDDNLAHAIQVLDGVVTALCPPAEVAMPAFQDSQSRVHSVALIHEKLYLSSEVGSIQLADYIPDLVREIFDSNRTDESRVELKIEVDELNLGVDAAINCGLIVNELVINALKHAFPADHEGVIGVEMLRAEAGMLRLAVWNTGLSLPENLDLKQKKSLGLKLVDSLVGMLKGELQVRSGERTEFAVTFPYQDPTGR